MERAVVGVGRSQNAPRMLPSQAEVSLSEYRDEDRQGCSGGGRAGESH